MKKTFPCCRKWLFLFLLSIGLRPCQGLAAEDVYFLHADGARLLLNTSSPTAATARITSSGALNKSAFVEIGQWSAVPALNAAELTAVSELLLWIGLKTGGNSGDSGTAFDLRAELLKNGETVASGLASNIRGLKDDPAKATPVIIGFGNLSGPVFNPGDVLALRILAKVSDRSGHRTAAGVSLFYDAVNRPARFGATFRSARSTISIKQRDGGGRQRWNDGCHIDRQPVGSKRAGSDRELCYGRRDGDRC